MLLRERVRIIKEGTSAVLVAIRLGWKSGGLIRWKITAICEMSKTSCQMGKHLTNIDLDNHLKDQHFRLAPW